MSYDAVRKDYDKYTLDEKDCPAYPLQMLDKWVRMALEENLDANAMVVSTVNEAGQPSSRVVLLRRLDERGIVFYTNYESQKGRELAVNHNAAANFFWPWMERQVRIEGVVEMLPEAESDEYFSGRPRESQLGAWASAQSDEMTSRDQLDKALDALRQDYDGKSIPRPAYWGGYLIKPTRFEFWQGRASRLHDRIEYQPTDEGWEFRRLFP